jgi:hypothetical protein
MKNKTKQRLMFWSVVILLGVVLYMWNNPRVRVEEVEVPVEVPVPVVREVVRRREPEFREAPVKKYKPGHTQAMGVLIGPNEEVLPLYGKESRYHRDRYHYYTVSEGQQLYPLPITINDRECTEDLGCNELYGGESVTVTGKTDTYTTKIYRTDNFF